MPVIINFKLCSSITPVLAPVVADWEIEYILSPNRQLELYDENIQSSFEFKFTQLIKKYKVKLSSFFILVPVTARAEVVLLSSFGKKLLKVRVVCP